MSEKDVLLRIAEALEAIADHTLGERVARALRAQPETEQVRRGQPKTEQPKTEQPEASPILCDHANENPARCVCAPRCYCRAVSKVCVGKRCATCDEVIVSDGSCALKR